MREPRRWENGTQVEAYHPGRPKPWPEVGPNFRPAVVLEQTRDGHYVRCRWDDNGDVGTTYYLNVRLAGEPDPVQVMR